MNTESSQVEASNTETQAEETQSAVIAAQYAVIKTGGKQYIAVEGKEFDIERIEGEKGDSLTFDQVLLYKNGDDVKVGFPLVNGVNVSATIVTQKRGPKLVSFKKIRRHGKQVKKGHRQDLTRIRITGFGA